ncbi:MAG: hypothetical protein NZ529_05895 [Cytophagaceae bacterium]|nr:hypothetical protein [Cytophagaceae bacterium]MDW8456310.1 hypothetical protein [Cytophagaceae bacterium]
MKLTTMQVTGIGCYGRLGKEGKRLAFRFTRNSYRLSFGNFKVATGSGREIPADSF